MEQHKDEIKVSLNLNDLIVQYVKQLLDKFATEHPHWKEEILCDLPQLCRDLCIVIVRYLCRHNCKGHKTKAARICSISDDTVRNYEKFVAP